MSQSNDSGLNLATWQERRTAWMLRNSQKREGPASNETFMEAEIKSLRAALANQPAQEQVEPIAYLRWWAHQRDEGHGNIGHEEGYEVCGAGELSDDKSPAFPVYDRPAAQQEPVAAPGAVKPELMRQAVATVVSRVGDHLRIGWLRPERCDVGTLLYCATERAAELDGGQEGSESNG